MSYQPTEIAIELAMMARDAEYIRSEVADNDLYMKVYQEECAEAGCTVEEMDNELYDDEMKAEIAEAIDRIPVDPNAEVDEVQKILQSDKEKISIDEVMGVKDADSDDDDEIVRELLDGLRDASDDFN